MKRGFYTIMTAQFFSSLADNALFVAAIELLRHRNAHEWQSAALVPMFALFYVLLAPFVGDRPLLRTPRMQVDVLADQPFELSLGLVEIVLAAPEGVVGVEADQSDRGSGVGHVCSMPRAHVPRVVVVWRKTGGGGKTAPENKPAASLLFYFLDAPPACLPAPLLAAAT